MNCESELNQKKQEYEEEIERVKFLLATYKMDRNLQAVFQILQKQITLTYFRTFNSIKSASKKAVGLHSIQILGGIERVYQRQVHKRYLDWFIKMRGGIDENKMTTLKKQISPKRGQNRKQLTKKTMSEGTNKRRCLKEGKKITIKKEQLDHKITNVREKIQMITKAYRQFMSKLECNNKKIPHSMMQSMHKF